MLAQRSLAVAFLAFAPLAFSAGNPHIIINGDPPDPTIITATSFIFNANSVGGGDFSFQNGSGVTWTDLRFNVTLPALEPITCGPGPFIICTITTTPEAGGSYLYNILFGPAALGGIIDGELFSINLNNDSSSTDPNGAGDWGPSNNFKGKANVPVVGDSPEPSTFGLGIGGLLLLAFGYRRYQRRATTD